MSNRSSKSVYSMVLLQYGTQQPILISNASEPIATTLGIAVAVPELSVDDITLTGAVDEKGAKFQIPLGLFGFTNALAAGVAAPPIKCRVLEYIDDGVDIKITTRARGLAKVATANDSGKEGLMVFEVMNEKQLLNQKAGTPCLDVCDFVLGDSDTCKVDIAPLKQTGTLTAILGEYTLVIDGLTLEDAGFWVTGDVERDDTIVKIVAWDGANQFTVDDNVNPDWVGFDVVLTPGCDGTVPVCEGTFDNLENIGAFGIGMVAYNPIFENPSR